MKNLFYLLLMLSLFACKAKDEGPPSPTDGMYFPSTTSVWADTSASELGWNADAIDSLYRFLQDNETRAFILLKDGKIVLEHYWGKTLLNTADFDASSFWYWASAGKTLSSSLVGIAQEEGLLSLDDKTSKYLGNGWTAMDQDKEDLITIRHQLTMTTGMDYSGDVDCTDDSCLKYKVDAGKQWYYHNAPYTLIEQVVANAAGTSYNQFTDNMMESRIGMSGNWIKAGFNNVYWSTARDAARFGLLLLNKGKWKDEQVMPEAYHNDMIRPSQDFNKAYGYLTWLNGHSPIMMPGLTIQLNTVLSTNAPNDLYAAMGKNGQYIDVVPSAGLVVIRMGDAPTSALVPTVFHNDMWEKINAVIY